MVLPKPKTNEISDSFSKYEIFTFIVLLPTANC